MQQLVVWIVCGSALWRLWDSETAWLWWSLVAAIVIESWVAATIIRVVRGGDRDVLQTGADLVRFKRLAVPLHIGITLAAIGLGIYGHLVA